MDTNKIKKRHEVREVWEEDIFGSYLQEMDELVNKYPEDPNKTDFNEERLTELIKELDNNWMSFRKKWRHKLETAQKVFGRGRVKKGKDGMRHLIIKSDFTEQDILDLSVPDTRK